MGIRSWCNESCPFYLTVKQHWNTHEIGLCGYKKNKVRNLYRIAWHNPEGHNHIKEKRPVRLKKAPNWEKICFQLEKFFFPVRNPVLGGVLAFLCKTFHFPLSKHPKNSKRQDKKILQKIAFPMRKYCHGEDSALSESNQSTAVPN